jgi:hypothetical protein
VSQTATRVRSRVHTTLLLIFFNWLILSRENKMYQMEVSLALRSLAPILAPYFSLASRVIMHPFNILGYVNVWGGIHSMYAHVRDCYTSYTMEYF